VVVDTLLLSEFVDLELIYSIQGT